MALEDRVAVALLVERELVLEARAAASAHADAQAGERHVGVLGSRNSRTFSAPLSVREIIAIKSVAGNGVP